MATRTEVYAAIDSERDYQDRLWNEHTTTSRGLHSFEEWLTYIRRYLRVMEEVLSTKPQQQGNMEAAHIMRKIAGMAVCCMEQNGAPKRVI